MFLTDLRVNTIIETVLLTNESQPLFFADKSLINKNDIKSCTGSIIITKIIAPENWEEQTKKYIDET